MRIYNYSDVPVIINGNEVSDTEIYLPNNINYAQRDIKHNGIQVAPDFDSESNRNLQFTITNHRSNLGDYTITQMDISPPEISSWAFTYFLFFGFYFMVRIMQKIKLS